MFQQPMILLALLLAANFYSSNGGASVSLLQAQGNSLCEFIASSNIEPLRSASRLVGWQCSYDTGYGGMLPYEDLQVSVCGNSVTSCNGTTAGLAGGCSDKNESSLRPWTGIKCDINYLITTLDLNSRSLSGVITSQLGGLVALKKLDLSSNSLTGPISSAWISSLLELETLELQNNKLTSAVPSSIGGLTKLYALKLQYNSLTSSIPSEIGLITGLTSIELNNNLFTGTFPAAIFHMPQVKEIYLQSNSLSNIPTLTQPANELTHLNFAYNSVINNVVSSPTFFDNLPQMKEFNGAYNALSGSLHSSWGNMLKLQIFQLNHNSITGPLPSSIGQLERLQEFYMNDNSLTGRIPNEIRDTTALTHVMLSSNSLVGSIPQTFYNLTVLQELDINSNSLTGAIPNVFYKMDELRVLKLFENSLTGYFPSSLGTLSYTTSLTYFDLSNNPFAPQTIPSRLFGMNCSQLQYFHCYECNLFGVIPVEGVQNLTDLVSLKLQTNSLNGTIPPLLMQMQVQQLYLSNNQITGFIPESSATCCCCIPSLAIEGYRLLNIDIGQNNLTGSIPDSLFSNNLNLGLVWLDYNQITGNFPSTVSRTPEGIYDIWSIRVNNNLMSGSLPPSIFQLTSIQHLDLSTNSFTASNFESLFSGESYNNWNELHLQNNNIASALPDLSLLTALEVLDLSSNMLIGSFSDGYFSTLVQLKKLYLNNNRLTGVLPSSLSALVHLTDCDIVGQIGGFSGDTSSLASVGSTDCYGSPTAAPYALPSGQPTSRPSSQPSSQPSAKPSSQPSAQPSGQPTTAPTYIFYDGKFVQSEEKVYPYYIHKEISHVRCNGELETRIGTYITEIWCIQKRHIKEYLYFSQANLQAALSYKRVRDTYYPLLDTSTIQSVIFRSKNNDSKTDAFQNGNCEVDDLDCFTSLEYSDGNSIDNQWQDTLIQCSHFGGNSRIVGESDASPTGTTLLGEKFNGKKTLPVARGASWSYGATAMAIKVKLSGGLKTGVPLDGPIVDINEEVANLYRTSTSKLVGAYLMIKGSAIGGRDNVRILSAHNDWSETEVTCDTSIQSLRDWNYTANVTLEHDTMGWSRADITDLVRPQLAWHHLYYPTQPMELNLLLLPDFFGNNRTFGREHFHWAAHEDIDGDTDIVMNGTYGRTEWYTSESSDPPLLLMFFQ